MYSALLCDINEIVSDLVDCLFDNQGAISTHFTISPDFQKILTRRIPENCIHDSTVLIRLALREYREMSKLL